MVVQLGAPACPSVLVFVGDKGTEWPDTSASFIAIAAPRIGSIRSITIAQPKSQAGVNPGPTIR
jgi:hypothetical protein